MLMKSPSPACFVAAAAMTLAAPATAALLQFVGSGNAIATPFADPACAPLPFHGIIPLSDGSGNSNLGSFSYGHDVCTQGATGAVTGTFVIDFGYGLLTGALDGSSTARPDVSGLFDQTFTYTISSGTGDFLGATGSFVNIGTVDVRGGLPSRLTFNFEGLIDAPAVPEPATWGMMIAGFAVIGGTLRLRRRTVCLI